ncbi:MAG TPA: 16S rRNA (cytosine(967)-C(5))-methyltransferase, partial [Pantoea sp.]|nr:16S rRNA (cytosine(967)-C(5))-methyltransferase [Pantoea sp.]
FLQRQHDAQAEPLWDASANGLQVFPEAEGGDGFFYAKLIKKSGTN